MALTIERGKKTEYVQHPVGAFAATLVAVKDEGVRENPFEPGQMNQEARLSYITTEMLEDGRPHMISEWVRVKVFKSSDGSKKSKMVERWEAFTGRDFNDIGDSSGYADNLDLIIRDCLHRPCLINVVRQKNGKSRIDTVVPLPKGMKAPVSENAPSDQAISNLELKHVWAAAEDRAGKFAGCTKELVVRDVYKTLGIVHSKDITVGKSLNSVISAIEGWKPGEVLPDPMPGDDNGPCPF